MGGLLVGGGPTGAWAQEPPPTEQEAPALDTSRVDSLGQAPEARPASTLPSVTPDTLDRPRPAVDSLTVDSLPGATAGTAPPDTGLVGRYLPARSRRTGGLFASSSPLLGPRSPTPADRSVTLDSTGTHYTLDDGPYADGPMRIGTESYRRASYRSNLRQNWTALVQQRQQQRADRGGVGVNLTVPGGRESAFTTIFGKPQVDLRVNGQADINAGFKYSKNDRRARTGNATQIDPSFKQDLRLGITGTIGDKMRINVDWDTKSQFDYQNQVKLEYTGYEDEIIQSIEAGNVFLETPSQLISGGQSLFGIKSTFQLGNLQLTTIASQQEGQSNTLSIEGGSETTEFTLNPTDYDEDSHYFLGYYFRNNWNRAHRDPTSITLSNGFDGVEEIEVWKLTTTTRDQETEVRNVAAVVDLGEPSALLQQADAFTTPVLPAPQGDQYAPRDIDNLRQTDSTNSVSSYVESAANLDQPLQAQDFESGDFKKLERGRDYRLDPNLGFISLKQRLRPNEALAVAYRYRVNGDVVEIGDFSGDLGGGSGNQGGNRLVLKLLRPTNPVAPGTNPSDEPPSWFLEMRNIYRVGGRGFDAENFNLDIEYNPSGQGASTTIPEVTGQTPLLQALGLDRIDQSGAPSPDNEFDFTGQTIDPSEGLIYFPYLEPFGERLFNLAEQTGTRSDAESVAFPALYLQKKSNAERTTGKNVFDMSGSYKGQAKGFYDLKAFTGLVDGSVKVTSGGQTLQEGTDYVVDYQSGTVNITNESYLTDGREIKIDYEQRSIANLQKKTLLGARADWSLRDEFALGATVMRLSEKSPVDKYRIGEEPIQNTIWGVDGSMNLEPRWLTRAVDALPLVQTRAESKLSLSGEFAQLRPGHTTTEAYEQTVEDVRQSDRDRYAPDERNGVSYIDDFEGFENTFSLREQLGAWQISAAPDSIAPLPNLDGDVSGNEDDRARTHWRGSFGWYQLNQGIDEYLDSEFGGQRGAATRLLNVQQVFPDRDTRGSANPTLRTLDFYFDPWERGPYNYTPNLEGFFRNPRRVWGGVTRQLPEGYTDFSVQNVEFVEFIVRVFPEEGRVSDGAKLFVNLGTIAEDVIPDDRLNTEDGLRLGFEPDDLGVLGRLARGNQDDVIDVQGSRTEDLGLDGLVSYAQGPYATGQLERTFYNDFVAQADSLRGAIGQLGLSSVQQERLRAEIARIQEDPSADDYHHYENGRYFNDPELFPTDPPPQQHFSRYYAGHELNGFESQNRLAEDVSIRQGLAGAPDTEDLDGTGGSVNITNRYYQYAIPLDSLDRRAGTDAGRTDYVVDEVGRENSNWYKVRIPVREFTSKVGNIEDFTSIQSIRMWTTGHASPVTMRFASMELVGSQWRTAAPVAQQPVDDGVLMRRDSTTELQVASINNEEDPDYEPPVGAIVSTERTAQGVQQRSREQALSLGVNKLAPGQQRGISKTFQQGLDLLKYSNLRMYTHVHGTTNDPEEKQKIRDNLRLFVRLGANETGDYYEYEQPLKPSDVPGTNGADPLWFEDFEMNLVLSSLSQLKTARSQLGRALDSTFTSEEVDLPLNFAPPGTELKIRGTPSLNQISTIVIGVRHAKNPNEAPAAPVLRNLEVWVNELRVSGFDEESGWATTSSANIQLADLATIQGNFQRSTDGFGALSSTLDQRQQANNMSWNVRTDLNVGALLPRRQGWQIPVTMQVQSSLTSPRFDPQRGDVRIQEVQNQFDIIPPDTLRNQFGYGPDAPIDQVRETLKDSVRRASQSYNLNRTFTASLSKSNSDSWWMQKTVDATSLNFSYLKRTGRSPQRSVNDQWSWSGSFDYQLGFGQARTVQPLWFLPDVPVLGALGDVSLNYVPTSLAFSASADRQVTTRRSRPATQQNNRQPARIRSPFRENQNFTHNRNFSLQYDPFNFLSLSFDTNTQQTLSDVAGRTQRNLIFSAASPIGAQVFSDVDTSAFLNNPPPEVAERLPADTTLRDLLGSSLFVEERLRQRSEGEVFRDLFLGDASPRTESYRQRLSATFRVGFLDRKALNWIDVQDVSYQAAFNWRNGARGSLTGASVDNAVTLRTGVSLQPNKVWERFGFYERMKQAQREDDADEGGRRRTPSGGEDAAAEGEEGESEDEDDDGGFGLEDVPRPDPVGLLRGLALTFMDIDDFTINYTGDRSSRATNVGIPQRNDAGTVTGVNTNYSLLDALQGNGPSLGYRLGLTRSIDTTRRVFQQGQVSNTLSNQHRFEARTALTPSAAFNIDLNWEVSWSTQPVIDFRRRQVQTGPPTGGPAAGGSPPTTIERFDTESGNVTASVWAFGSYQSLIEKQLSKLRRVTETADTVQAGQAPLTTSSTAADFRSGYLVGGRGIAGNGFVPFPMPGWTVRYSGLSDWPLVNRVVESLSLNHSYNATYTTSFNSNSTAGETETVPVGGAAFPYEEAEFQPQTVQISERFQPLIGVDVTWPWEMQTSLEWGRQVTTKLVGSNVVERKSSELSGSVSYSKRGLRLPFFSRIDNRIRLSISFTRSTSDEREFLLNEALTQAQQNPDSFDPGQALEGSNADVLTKQTRYTVSPRISYTISDRFTADFRLDYEKLNVQTGRQTSFTNLNGTFNLSVSLSQN